MKSSDAQTYIQNTVADMPNGAESQSRYDDNELLETAHDDLHAGLPQQLSEASVGRQTFLQA